MQPRNGFVSVVQDAGEADAAVWQIRGADVSAVAFIPRTSMGALPACGLTAVDAPLRDGAVSLLAEGTDPPPPTFDGPDDWLRAMRRRQHRGALALVEPTAYLDRDERIVRVAFRLSSAVVGAGFVQRESGLTFGTGASTDARRYRVTIADRFARIDCWQRFSLASACDLHGRFEGGDTAPLGWLLITSFLHVDGTSQGWCGSSYLPSAWFYRDYIRTHRRELDQASAPEVEAVLTSKPDVATGTRWTSMDTSTGCVNAVA